jgi:hypothetical protein
MRTTIYEKAYPQAIPKVPEKIIKVPTLLAAT